jgi:tRNA A37 threonylcarbamoyladenosine modification protein TsaB
MNNNDRVILLIDIFVLSISKPILVGVYKNNKLIDSYTNSNSTSDSLPYIFDIILEKYHDIDNLYFVNSPGSYMSIKISYIFLNTFSIINDIPLYATSGFYFNYRTPIKAIGKKFFIYNNGDLVIDFLENNNELRNFYLPSILDSKIFTKNILPTYDLSCV